MVLALAKAPSMLKATANIFRLMSKLNLHVSSGEHLTTLWALIRQKKSFIHVKVKQRVLLSVRR
jgi:hypothetical protein